MRSPRSVMRAPIGIPSRILNCATDLRARRICARWPAMIVSSSIAGSSTLASVFASPTPMLSVIFVMRGTCMIDVEAELLLQLVAQLVVVALLQARHVGRLGRGHQRSISWPQPSRLQTRTLTVSPFTSFVE